MAQEVKKVLSGVSLPLQLPASANKQAPQQKHNKLNPKYKIQKYEMAKFKSEKKESCNCLLLTSF